MTSVSRLTICSKLLYSVHVTMYDASLGRTIEVKYLRRNFKQNLNLNYSSHSEMPYNQTRRSCLMKKKPEADFLVWGFWCNDLHHLSPHKKKNLMLPYLYGCFFACILQICRYLLYTNLSLCIGYWLLCWNLSCSDWLQHLHINKILHFLS